MVIKLHRTKMHNRNRFYVLKHHCGKKEKPHNCGELERSRPQNSSSTTGRCQSDIEKPLENCVFWHEQLNKRRISGIQISGIINPIHFSIYVIFHRCMRFFGLPRGKFTVQCDLKENKQMKITVRPERHVSGQRMSLEMKMKFSFQCFILTLMTLIKQTNERLYSEVTKPSLTDKSQTSLILLIVAMC